jgi:hypothetical protein
MKKSRAGCEKRIKSGRKHTCHDINDAQGFAQRALQQLDLRMRFMNGD